MRRLLCFAGLHRWAVADERLLAKRFGYIECVCLVCGKRKQFPVEDVPYGAI